MTMTDRYYPENEKLICTDIFHWYAVGKTLPPSTHHVYYDDDLNGMAIIFPANMENDDECIKAAISVLETTKIKNWCTRLVVYRLITPNSTERIFEKEYKPNIEE